MNLCDTSFLGIDRHQPPEVAGAKSPARYCTFALPTLWQKVVPNEQLVPSSAPLANAIILAGAISSQCRGRQDTLLFSHLASCSTCQLSILRVPLPSSTPAHDGLPIERKILSSLPRVGEGQRLHHTRAIWVSASSDLPRSTPTDGGSWTATGSAHLNEVGVALPALTPGFGIPVEGCSFEHDMDCDPHKRGRSRGDSDSVQVEISRPGLLAMKALDGSPWPAPPSLSHAGRQPAAARLAHAVASRGEDEGHAELISTLER